MSKDTAVITRQDPDTSGIEKLEKWASSIEVTTPEERKFASTIMADVRKTKRQIKDWFADSKAKAHAAWKAVVAQEKTLTDRCDTVEKAVTRELRRYDAAVEQKRREEQARLQAEAEEKARKERERLEKQAAKLKTPEKKQERMEQAAAIVAPVVQIETPDEKADGEQVRMVWKAECEDIGQVIRSAAASEHAVGRSVLKFDQTAANKLAAATKGSMQIPGVRFFQERVYAHRG